VKCSFAVYVPIGPSKLDLVRLSDLLTSLLKFEPNVETIILADHGPTSRDFTPFIRQCPREKIHIIRPCRQFHSGTWLGAACAANLIALRLLQDKLEIGYLLKMDTDSLIIAPFSESLAGFFEVHPRAGLVGALGSSCNRSNRSFEWDAVALTQLRSATLLARRLGDSSLALDNKQILSNGLFTHRQVDNFRFVMGSFEKLLNSNYDGSHCQGGAYAVGRELISRLNSLKISRDPSRWLYLRLPEDRMMALCCAACGLEILDFSLDGQSFGVQAQGLAYPPRELLDRGYQIIHSVRSDTLISEANIRSFFLTHRSND
jgi:hypothetical protein